MWILGVAILMLTAWEAARGKIGIGNILYFRVEKIESPILFWSLLSCQGILGAAILFEVI